MKHAYPDDIRAELAFAARAAKWFTEHPKGYSYTDDGGVEQGALLALRWGGDDDCVLALRISDTHEPTIYAQMINRDEAAKAQRGNASLLVPRADLYSLVTATLSSATHPDPTFLQRIAREAAVRWAAPLNIEVE